MRNCAKPFLAIVLLLLLNAAFSQNFLNSELKPDKTYMLFAHPTIQNIETIQFLLKNNILKLPDAEFVGIYSDTEIYDYGKSLELLKKPEMARFHLQWLKGEINMDSVYSKNAWTSTFKRLFDHSAGIFFFGGPDIQPELYGQKNLYSIVTDPNRHSFELSFLFHLIGGKQNETFIPFLKEKPHYFVSGFCLGMQSMNVAAGGTLIQDIPTQIYKKVTPEEILKLRSDQLHRNYWKEISQDSLLMGINFHPIQFTSTPFFSGKVKVSKRMTPVVLSSHHQSVDELGKDLIVTAASIDEKVIEGIQHRLYPNVFSVQFHPEVPSLYEEQKKLKFAPTDTPKSYFKHLSGQDRKFHLKYWKTISKAITSSIQYRE